MAEIKKFGKIYEREDGQLIYEGFHVDCKGSIMPPGEVLMHLVVERIQKDMQFEKLTPKELEAKVLEQRTSTSG